VLFASSTSTRRYHPAARVTIQYNQGMRVLVTGATGLIGNAIARQLALRGHAVRALVRDLERARPLLPAEVSLVRGDVTAPETLDDAVREVDWVFHAAGMPEQWQRDESIFDRVNRQGTAHVCDAALAAGVKRLIYTSTMDVFAAPSGGTLVEGNIDHEPKHTAYERSKQAAEQEAEQRRARGLDLVYVNPGAVYGPSPSHVGLNSFFLQLVGGKMPMVPPGGMSVLYVDGCTAAHLAAAERGVSGDRYLVADQHVSCADLAGEIARQSGARLPRNGPVWLVRTLAATSAPLARMFGFRPLVAPGQLTFILWDAHVDATKARQALGFEPTPLVAGVERTLAFLRAEGLIAPRA
jgi:dihydroflavonol-4-reductase